MDSPTVVLENSSDFPSVPPRLELFLPVLLVQHQIQSPETLQLSYSLILVAFFNKNLVPLGNVSQRCVLLGMPKICLVDFLV